MNIQTADLTYENNGIVFAAHVAWQQSEDGVDPMPAVLICHDAMGGKSDFEKGRARALAELGYVGVAIDAFGHDHRAANAEQAYALMDPLRSNRSLLRERLKAGLDFARQLSQVDAQKIAVIGYCFGGLCALELARSGEDIVGAVSFHGLLTCDDKTPTETINAKLLVLNGWNDPFVPAEDVLAFSKEMTEQGADWQLLSYGHGLHSFSNPLANDRANGIGYDETIDRRSWKSMSNFLQEVFNTQPPR